ncbi:hypothetical protein LXL04_003407 [Taraxacum kok-saghyz]
MISGFLQMCRCRNCMGSQDSCKYHDYDYILYMNKTEQLHIFKFFFFQQAEEHCSKAISLDKKVRYKFCETIPCLEDAVEKMKIQCLEGGYVGNYH